MLSSWRRCLLCLAVLFPSWRHLSPRVVVFFVSSTMVLTSDFSRHFLPTWLKQDYEKSKRSCVDFKRSYIAKIEDENDGQQPSTSFHGSSQSFSDAVDN